MQGNTSIYIYIVVSIVAISILVGFLIKCKNEPYITKNLYDETYHPYFVFLCNCQANLSICMESVSTTSFPVFVISCVY